MAGAVKHAMRSHRSYNNHGAVFSRFDVIASKVKTVKQLKTVTGKTPILDKLKKLFKHQDR